MFDYIILGTATLGGAGTREVTRAEGFTGLPGIRGIVFDRPEEDGAVDSPNQYLGMRVPAIDAETWGATIAATWADWRIIAAALETAVTTDTLLQWRESGGTIGKRGSCRVIGDILPVFDGDEFGSFIRYSATFRLVDPRWYSDTEQNSTAGAPTFSGGIPTPLITPIPVGSGSSGGSVTATNGGSTKTWPTIVIQGPIVGPVIENATLGRALYFPTLNLAAGQTLTITTNPDGRGAVVAGAGVLGTLDYQLSKWFWLAVGANTVRFYGSSGYGVGTTMTVYWRDAYQA